MDLDLMLLQTENKKTHTTIRYTHLLRIIPYAGITHIRCGQSVNSLYLSRKTFSPRIHINYYTILRHKNQVCVFCLTDDFSLFFILLFVNFHIIFKIGLYYINKVRGTPKCTEANAAIQQTAKHILT